MLCVCMNVGIRKRRPYAIFPAFIYTACLGPTTYIHTYVRTYDEWIGAHASVHTSARTYIHMCISHSNDFCRIFTHYFRPCVN